MQIVKQENTELCYSLTYFFLTLIKQIQSYKQIKLITNYVKSKRKKGSASTNLTKLTLTYYM